MHSRLGGFVMSSFAYQGTTYHSDMISLENLREVTPTHNYARKPRDNRLCY